MTNTTANVNNNLIDPHVEPMSNHSNSNTSNNISANNLSSKTNLTDKINILTQEFKMKKLNLQYNYTNGYDDEDDEDDGDDDMVNGRVYHNEKSDSGRASAAYSLENPHTQLPTFKAPPATLLDECLNDTSLNESDLIELIRRQIKQKNFKLESFVDNYDELNDVFEDGSTSAAAAAAVKDIERRLGRDYNYLNGDGEDEEGIGSGGGGDDDDQEIEEDYDPNQISPQNNRLSTILEVSCEESPFKKPSALKEYSAKQQQKNEKFEEETIAKPLRQIETKTQNSVSNVVAKNFDENDEVNDESNEEEEDREEQKQKPLDIDSLPIGFKPTNKMSFEQLIEEKLKIAEQLDQEQFKNSTSNKTKKKPIVMSKTREKFIQSKSAAAAAAATKSQQPTVSTSVLSNNNTNKAAPKNVETNVQGEKVSEATDASVGAQAPSLKQPCKFLKRGEGLKRYQPPSVKTAQKSSVSLILRFFLFNSN
jgi:hypothetical protein